MAKHKVGGAVEPQIGSLPSSNSDPKNSAALPTLEGGSKSAGVKISLRPPPALARADKHPRARGFFASRP